MIKFFNVMLLITMLFALTACEKVTMENYKKIETGMNYGDVVSILGEPDNCETLFTAKSCQWGSEKRKIDIKFIGDEVVLYASAGLS